MNPPFKNPIFASPVSKLYKTAAYLKIRRFEKQVFSVQYFEITPV